VTVDDSSPIVAATMRDHNLKWVPVVDNIDNMYVKGYVRRDEMINYVLNELHGKEDESL